MTPTSDVATSPDGLPIRFTTNGDGEPTLVLIHGWSCDRRYWRGQVSGLADRYRVVAIDLAGHGDSGTGRTAYTMSAFGADVAAVIDRLGLRGAILVGHSMGGDVAIEAALARPDAIAGVVWADVYRKLGEPDDPADVAAFVDRFRADFRTAADGFVRRMFPPEANAEVVDWVATDMASAPPEIAIDAMRHALANEGPVIEALARLTVPVVAINPDYRATDEASLREHGVTTVLLTGVGHFAMLEDPDQFNRVLDGVVRELARAGAAEPA